MSSPLPKLEPGQDYHIYNRASGNENLFREESDYRRFLQLYSKYIDPVVQTLAWVLMPNHFHLLVRVKGDLVYKYSKEDFAQKTSKTLPDADRFSSFDDVKWETIPRLEASQRDIEKGSSNLRQQNKAKAPKADLNYGCFKIPDTARHIAHLCSSYTKYINEKQGRTGNLFQRPFKRKQIDNEGYLKQVVLYIHNNPVHHGFVDHPNEYYWSSYHAYTLNKKTKLHKAGVIEQFQGRSDFVKKHEVFKYNHFMDVGAWLELG